VSDLNRSKQFYQQVFGFHVLMESQEASRPFAFLGEDSQIVLTLWQQSNGKFAKNVPGLHHLSFQVCTMDEVRDIEQRLRDECAASL
jgi:lactoylglutathione lyase